MSKKIKWGIIAPGGISEKFATGINASNNGELYAVCSRNIAKAESFIKKFGGVKAYDSEKAIASDPDVDIIYISNPHPFHLNSALNCLNSGKPVLCEKPMTVNAKGTKVLVEAARKNNVFLMEAMWTRFLPAICKVREILSSGIIGDVRLVTADFGMKINGIELTSRLFDPALAGGALLDVGIYPLALCSMVLGKPTRIQSSAYLGRTGVDEQFTALLDYEGGAMSTISGAVDTQTSHNAWIYGSKGSIKIKAPWWGGEHLSLYRLDPEAEAGACNYGDEEIIDLPYEANGYNCEAEAVANMILDGKKESEIMPLDETIELAETMDILRGQWGLKYPFE